MLHRVHQCLSAVGFARYRLLTICSPKLSLEMWMLFFKTKLWGLNLSRHFLFCIRSVLGAWILWRIRTEQHTQPRKSQIKWMLHNFSAMNNEQPNSFGCSLRSLIKMNSTVMGYYYKVQKHLLKAVKIIVTRKSHLRAKLYSASFLSWRDKCLSVGDFPKALAAGYE